MKTETKEKLLEILKENCLCKTCVYACCEILGKKCKTCKSPTVKCEFYKRID